MLSSPISPIPSAFNCPAHGPRPSLCCLHSAGTVLPASHARVITAAAPTIVAHHDSRTPELPLIRARTLPTAQSTATSRRPGPQAYAAYRCLCPFILAHLLSRSYTPKGSHSGLYGPFIRASPFPIHPDFSPPLENRRPPLHGLSGPTFQTSALRRFALGTFPTLTLTSSLYCRSIDGACIDSRRLSMLRRLGPPRASPRVLVAQAGRARQVRSVCSTS